MELGKFIPALCMILGLMKPSMGVDDNCNFEQELDPGLTYYVYNPQYPNYYYGQHSCQWRARNAHRVRLNCQNFTIPASPNCSREAMIVQVGNGIEYNLCGLNSFVVESQSSEMVIKFRSRYDSLGGKFRCELTALEEPCNCGWKNPNRIVGGVETGVNEYPMMAGLASVETRLLFCGATIITNRYVITAAHCVRDYVNNSTDLIVVVGEHDVTTGVETDATRVHFVENVIVHPNYVGPTVKNDVALVKSLTNIMFSMKVGPACLPFYYTNNDFTGDTVTALGWGTLWYGGKKSKTLMKVDLDVIPLQTCAEDYDNITSSKICTYRDGKDACQFDSGGPILWQNPQSNHVILVGVISYGKTCADKIPGVNSRVTSFLNFIQNTINDYSFCRLH